MTLEAYERKEELGGGWRAVVHNHMTKISVKSPVLPTKEAARHWAKEAAHKEMNGAPYTLAHMYGKNYKSNLWITR